MVILPRYGCNNYNDGYNNIYNNCDDYSPWSSYGRWIVLAAIIVGAFLIFLLFSCITARRRRRLGQNPYRGTGWAAGAHGPAQYTGGAQPYYANNNAAPPPVYSPENQGYYNQGANQGANQGYFGGQQQGVELQQPPNAYARGGDNVYQPPSGPPPGKTAGDGIVR